MSRKPCPFRRDRVYLAKDEVERLTQCGCATCVTLRQSLGHDSAGRACLREEALARERVLDHLERVLGRAVGFGDPLRVSPFAFATHRQARMLLPNPKARDGQWACDGWQCHAEATEFVFGFGRHRRYCRKHYATPASATTAGADVFFRQQLAKWRKQNPSSGQ